MSMYHEDMLHWPDVATVLEAALRAVDPEAAIRAQVTCEDRVLRIGPRAYPLDEIGRILVVGGGKAGAPMATALAAILGTRISSGLVNVKYGHTARSTGWQISLGASGRDLPPREGAATGRITLQQAGHPVPDAAGLAGTARMVALLRGLEPRDLVIVLVSGGGSALLPSPAPGITLEDLQALTATLLACGASITEINTVRKHCSQLQGGQLARLAAPAQVATLILSDVVGTPLDAIASGPTVPDRTRYADALAVLQRYQVLDRIPLSISSRLAQGVAGSLPETPKPGDPLFARVDNLVIGDNAIAGRAAAVAARRLGWQAHLLTTFLQGEAREVGRALAGLGQGIACGQSDFQAPICLLLGGETTVTLRGPGKGGRNQELALSAAIALNEYAAAGQEADVTLVSLATDGNDGPTDAAGGLVTTETVTKGTALGLDAYKALAANDSYHYLAALQGLVITGPTNTNVNDLALIFVAGTSQPPGT